MAMNGKAPKKQKTTGPASSSSTTSTTDRKPSFGPVRDASQRRQQGGFRPVTPEAVHGDSLMGTATQRAS